MAPVDELVRAFFKWFFGVSAGLFVANVLAVTFDFPWYLQPFAVLIEGGKQVTTVVIQCASFLARCFIEVAALGKRLVKALFDKLWPAIVKSAEDYVEALWGGLPTWFTEFWNSFAATIAAAATIVAPWATWIVVALAVAAVLALAYWLLCVRTQYGPRAWLWLWTRAEERGNDPPPQQQLADENIPRTRPGARSRAM